MTIEVQELYGYLIQDPVVDPEKASFVQEFHGYIVQGANATSQGNMVDSAFVTRMNAAVISGPPTPDLTVIYKFSGAVIEGPPPPNVTTVKNMRGYIITE